MYPLWELFMDKGTGTIPNSDGHSAPHMKHYRINRDTFARVARMGQGGHNTRDTDTHTHASNKVHSYREELNLNDQDDLCDQLENVI